MKCFKCNGDIKSDKYETPWNATIWTTNGNFGSGVYDHVIHEPSLRLKIYICDDCLIKNKNKVIEQEIKYTKSVKNRVWRP